jgi:hypothetical protein
MLNSLRLELNPFAGIKVEVALTRVPATEKFGHPSRECTPAVRRGVHEMGDSVPPFQSMSSGGVEPARKIKIVLVEGTFGS